MAKRSKKGAKGKPSKKPAQSKKGELSEKEVEAAAGGTTFQQITTTWTTGGVTFNDNWNEPK
jgi:hypothetical protein